MSISTSVTGFFRAEGVGYSPGAFRIHFLQQEHIGVSESRLAGQNRDGAVHLDPILDVEGDYLERDSVLRCVTGADRRATGVTRASRIRVVPSGRAPQQPSQEQEPD